MRMSILAAALAAVGTGTAWADDAEDIAAGADLAQRWCTGCHVIGPDAEGGDAGPTFESVANRPGVTEQGVMNWLAEPHPPMPDLNLTASDARVLTSYIFSLSE